MLQQAAAMGERSQFAGRLKMPTLVVLSGNSDQKEYVITSKLAVIGKSKMATVRLKGWFKPEVAAQINQRDDGYYIGPGDKTPLVNSKPIQGPVRLNNGDTIEVCGLRLNFVFSRIAQFQFSTLKVSNTKRGCAVVSHGVYVTD